MLDFTVENQLRQEQLRQQEEILRQQDEQRRIIEEQQRQMNFQMQHFFSAENLQ